MKSVIYFAKKWPRYNSSAATHRTLGIIKSLLDKDYKINFVCSQNIVENYDESLKDLSVNFHQCEINNQLAINDILHKIGNYSISIYDTFISEEFFSHYTEGLKILDTQDLHFLREIRRGLSNKKIIYDDEINFPDIIENKLFLREMASIYRSDIVIVCSDFEYELLINLFDIPKEKIVLLSFFYDYNDALLNYEERKNFVFIGNYIHKPNKESVIYAVKEIFPRLLTKFNEYKPEMHIYGVNIDSDIKNLESKYVKVKGFMKNLKTLRSYKALIAPILYGAGIKGKITDCWYYDTPVVTSYYGAESLLAIDYKVLESINTYKEISSEYSKFIFNNSNSFGGFIVRTEDEFIDKCKELYTNKYIWEEKVKNAKNILFNRMEYNINKNKFLNLLNNYSDKNIPYSHKSIQKVILSETLRSTKYMAKYIDNKNK